MTRGDAMIGIVLLALITLGVGLLLLRVGKSLRMAQRDHTRKLDQAWSRLASNTGLSFSPSREGFFQDQGSNVFGNYRGHPVSLTQVYECSGDDVYASGDCILYTKIVLKIINAMNASLSVRKGGFLSKGIQGMLGGWYDPSGTPGLGNLYVQGAPSKFVENAIHVLMRHKRILLEPPAVANLVTDEPLWKWQQPWITLRGSDLVCQHFGMLKNIDDEIAFLDVMSELAELTEEMQEQAAIGR
jgi:hypothetical protein